MKPLKIINKIKPHYIASDNNEISALFQRYENSIAVITQLDRNDKVYKTFNENFSLFLQKLPKDLVQKTVSEVFNKELVYLGVSTTHNPGIFARVGVEGDKLRVIVLDARLLNIDIQTGETNNIDDCVYATYFGAVRGSILAHESTARSDTNLHQLLITYLYLLLLKTLGKQAYLNDKQKAFLMLLTAYGFAVTFLGDSNSAALYRIKKSYLKLLPNLATYYEDFRNIEALKNFKHLRDIFKYSIILNILPNENPNTLLLTLIKITGQSAFYSITSSMDTLAAFICTVRYPFSFYNQSAIVNDRLHKSVAEYIDQHYFQKTKLVPLFKG